MRLESVVEVVVCGDRSGRGRSGIEALNRIMRISDGVDDVEADMAYHPGFRRVHWGGLTLWMTVMSSKSRRI